MHNKRIRRAIVLAVAGLLLAAVAVFADTIRADGDVTNSVLDPTAYVGAVAPGATKTVEVSFVLTCSGTSRHVDADQTITLVLGSRTVPAGGNATATNAVFAANYPGWPTDGNACPSPAPEPVMSKTNSVVTLTAPMTVGNGYVYTLFYNRTLSPSRSTDTSTFSGSTAVTLILDVVPVVVNTAPVVTVPADMTVEGNTTGGADVSWTASATDAEDDPDPAVSCTPASGSFFGLGGPTAVSCSATDSRGLTTTASFNVTVVDTTAPTMTGVPAGLSLVTNDPAGAAISYANPTASDIVDPNPTVSCSPASGSVAPVGESTVTCTATDASGNSSTATFGVTVYLNAAPVVTVPANMTVEANVPGGANVTYTASATDAEDDPDPAVTCSRASGAFFGLGTTTVTCSTTDSGGRADSASFTVEVVDTTAPTLSGGPGSVSVNTSSLSGATVSYTAPTATDAADDSPTVKCSPASGSVFPVGDSTVTCTATDASGNSSSMSFAVHVTYISPDVWTASWEEPIGGSPAQISVNGTRSLPVKVRLYVNGVEVVSGNVYLRLTPCSGTGATIDVPMTFGGRWTAKLDTSIVPAGCFHVSAMVGTADGGWFRLDVLGPTPVKQPMKGPSSTSKPS